MDTTYAINRLIVIQRIFLSVHHSRVPLTRSVLSTPNNARAINPEESSTASPRMLPSPRPTSSLYSLLALSTVPGAFFMCMGGAAEPRGCAGQVRVQRITASSTATPRPSTRGTDVFCRAGTRNPLEILRHVLLLGRLVGDPRNLGLDRLRRRARGELQAAPRARARRGHRLGLLRFEERMKQGRTREGGSGPPGRRGSGQTWAPTPARA